MKFVILDWGFASSGLKRLGFEHNQEMDGDPYEVMKTIYEGGLNVMLLHATEHDGNEVNRIWVDTKSFRQR